eukprot:CAMPEP_0198141770 /NCGR_PEP_ID=MMETSP1443-20131203/4711_1 /TAXON_ID=186043 /ORGANISM="Entomoneis sp., Strain CCMP2396" /LENGTH=212 /DNA_ID=CAMNT_0043804603 /DNA_START=455 /DNA_END=1096 /DNA_ORIENTATION=+
MGFSIETSGPAVMTRGNALMMVDPGMETQDESTPVLGESDVSRKDALKTIFTTAVAAAALPILQPVTAAEAATSNGRFAFVPPLGKYLSGLKFLGEDFGRGMGELALDTSSSDEAISIIGTTKFFKQYTLNFKMQKNQVLFTYKNFLASDGVGSKIFDIVSDEESMLVIKEARLGALEVKFIKKAPNVLQIEFVGIPLPGTGVTGASATLNF